MAGSVVQLVGANSGSAGTTIASGAFGSNVTAGNIIQVEATCDSLDTVTITKNAGTATIGTPVQREAVTEAGTNSRTLVLTVPVTGTGTLDLLATFGSSHTTRGIGCAEISGAAGYHASISGTDTGNNPTNSITATATVAPTFGVMMGVDVQGGTLSAGTGWTSAGSTGTGADNCTTQYQAIAATGAVSGNFANAGFDRNNSAIILYTLTGPPTFSANPQNQQIIEANTATFSASASSNGGTGLGYQWQDDSSGSFANITGATSSSYTTTILSAQQSGRRYQVIATDSNGSVTSTVATVIVLPYSYQEFLQRVPKRPGGMTMGLDIREWW